MKTKKKKKKHQRASFSPRPGRHWAWRHWPEPANSADGSPTAEVGPAPGRQSTPKPAPSTTPPTSGPSHLGTRLPEWPGALTAEHSTFSHFMSWDGSFSVVMVKIYFRVWIDSRDTGMWGGRETEGVFFSVIVYSVGATCVDVSFLEINADTLPWGRLWATTQGRPYVYKSRCGTM